MPNKLMAGLCIATLGVCIIYMGLRLYGANTRFKEIVRNYAGGRTVKDLLRSIIFIGALLFIGSEAMEGNIKAWFLLLVCAASGSIYALHRE